MKKLFFFPLWCAATFLFAQDEMSTEEGSYHEIDAEAMPDEVCDDQNIAKSKRIMACLNYINYCIDQITEYTDKSVLEKVYWDIENISLDLRSIYGSSNFAITVTVDEEQGKTEVMTKTFHDLFVDLKTAITAERANDIKYQKFKYNLEWAQAKAQRDKWNSITEGSARAVVDGLLGVDANSMSPANIAASAVQNAAVTAAKIAETSLVAHHVYIEAQQEIEQQLTNEDFNRKITQITNFNKLRLNFDALTTLLAKEYHLPESYRITNTKMKEMFAMLKGYTPKGLFNVLHGARENYKTWEMFWAYYVNAALCCGEKDAALEGCLKYWETNQELFNSNDVGAIVAMQEISLLLPTDFSVELSDAVKQRIKHAAKYLETNGKSDWRSFLMRGYAYDALGEHEKAVEKFKAAISEVEMRLSNSLITYFDLFTTAKDKENGEVKLDRIDPPSVAILNDALSQCRLALMYSVARTKPENLDSALSVVMEDLSKTVANSYELSGKVSVSRIVQAITPEIEKVKLTINSEPPQIQNQWKERTASLILELPFRWFYAGDFVPEFLFLNSDGVIVAEQMAVNLKQIKPQAGISMTVKMVTPLSNEMIQKIVSEKVSRIQVNLGQANIEIKIVYSFIYDPLKTVLKEEKNSIMKELFSSADHFLYSLEPTGVVKVTDGFGEEKEFIIESLNQQECIGNWRKEASKLLKIDSFNPEEQDGIWNSATVALGKLRRSSDSGFASFIDGCQEIWPSKYEVARLNADAKGNFKKGVELLGKANFSIADYYRGKACLEEAKKKNNKREEENAVEILKTSADKGKCVLAMRELADYYRNHDEDVYLNYLTKAARFGEVNSQFELGAWNLKSAWSNKDVYDVDLWNFFMSRVSESLQELYIKKGKLADYNKLDVFVFNDDYLTEAKKWLEGAIENGHASAMKYYALLLQDPACAKDNPRTAEECLAKAAMCDDVDAQVLCGYFLLLKQQEAEAINWFEKAAGKGSRIAWFVLGSRALEENRLGDAEEAFEKADFKNDDSDNLLSYREKTGGFGRYKVHNYRSLNGDIAFKRAQLALKKGDVNAYMGLLENGISSYGHLECYYELIGVMLSDDREMKSLAACQKVDAYLDKLIELDGDNPELQHAFVKKVILSMRELADASLYLKWLTYASQKIGDVDSQVELADWNLKMYEREKKKEYGREAEKWYGAAGKAKSERALLQLHKMYQEGIYVKKNDKKAEKYLTLAQQCKQKESTSEKDVVD